MREIEDKQNELETYIGKMEDKLKQTEEHSLSYEMKELREL